MIKIRALGASAVAATAKARALICEDDARRALADAQIRDICATKRRRRLCVAKGAALRARHLEAGAQGPRPQQQQQARADDARAPRPQTHRECALPGPARGAGAALRLRRR